MRHLLKARGNSRPSRQTLGLAVSLLVLALVMSSLPLSAQTQIRLGQTIEGELGPGDKMLHDGTYYDLYLFHGESRRKVTLDLMSPDFDPYLTLLDQDGMELVSDHDSGGQRHARIVVTLPYSGRYYIRVNSVRKNQKGKYTLRVQGASTDDG